jgi:hypothetical protein
MESLERLVAAWDFRGAWAALDGVRFEEPELTARVAQRREEIRRMGTFKIRMIEKINAASPPLKKTDLMLRGMGGQVTKADEEGLTVTLASGKAELHAWANLGEKAREKLLQFAANPENPDDCLAAGMLAFACKDAAAAERHFEKARSLGAKIDSYLAPLAALAFVRAQELLQNKDFAQADAALASLEEKYARIPWFTANKSALAAAKAQAKAGICEAQAEKLYQEAADLFDKDELFDVKPLVEKLKTDYPQSKPVTDATRKPSFADLEQSTATLGRIITVRQDGKGDFTSIQAAIAAAEPKSVIQIEDDGPYNEKIDIPAEKKGVRIRGKRGFWPLISSWGAEKYIDILVTVRASETTLERVVLAHSVPAGRTPACLVIRASGFQLRSAIVFMQGLQALTAAPSCAPSVDDCVIIGMAEIACHGFLARNCLWLGTHVAVDPKADLRCCTVPGRLELGNHPDVVVDCAVGRMAINPTTGHQVEYSDIWELLDRGAKLGKGCFSADPQFRDPANLDFRPMPGSPCIGKASDGGDIGCRYTPEMTELCQVALELRRRGILKF